LYSFSFVIPLPPSKGDKKCLSGKYMEQDKAFSSPTAHLFGTGAVLIKVYSAVCRNRNAMFGI
jgi:hypothetical protein